MGQANAVGPTSIEGSWLLGVVLVFVQVIENCSVTGIETYTDDYGTTRIRSVQTDRGRINTSTVVNCAGISLHLV